MLPEIISNAQSPSGTKIALATIFLGANDVVTSGGKQSVPLKDYRDNLEYMTQTVLGSCSKLVLICPPPGIIYLTSILTQVNSGFFKVA